MPSPALALHADLALRDRQVELGEQPSSCPPTGSRTGCSSTVSIDRALSACFASRWNQLRGSRASIRSWSNCSTIGGPATRRRCHAVAVWRIQRGAFPSRSIPSSALAAASRPSVAAIWISTTGRATQRRPSTDTVRCRVSAPHRWVSTPGSDRMEWPETPVTTIRSSRSNPSSPCSRAAVTWLRTA